MDLPILKEKIRINNVPENWYSLDGIKPGSSIVYENYDVYEYFYLDEKTGNRNGYRVFNTADEAYAYLWEKLELNLDMAMNSILCTVLGIKS